jgi:hypothetical protein
MPATTQRRIARLILAVLGSTGLCSCASDPFLPLADALLGPKNARTPTVEAAAITRASQTRPTDESCSQIGLVAPTDVDTAYARVMARLRFRTLDERKRFADQYSSGLMDEGFRHTAQPGSYYRLADLVGWQGSGGAREAAWLEIELSREGASRTRFVGTYCLSSADPHYLDSSFRAALERRLRDSVK